MGQALKSPLRIPALDHGIAESVDDLVVGTDDSRIAAKKKEGSQPLIGDFTTPVTFISASYSDF